MRTAEPRLDRRSALATWLAFGLLAMLLPGATAPAPPDPPPAVAPPPAHVAVPVVLTERVEPPAPAEPEPEPTDAATAEVGKVAVAQPAPARVVALTFDDGPDPRWTPQVLDLLAEHGAVATFCVVGEKAAKHPELVRRVVEAGMRLCDHSHTHDDQLPTRSVERMTEEILDTHRDLVDLAAVPVPYFRAPGGNWSDPMLQMAADAAMQPLGWSVDPRDWRKPGAAAIVAAVQDQVHPGAIVLLHDGGGQRGQTVAALEQLLPWLTAQGYAFGFPTP